jgi:glycosyltransferase involved in cell wall biosynthesis
MTPTLSILLPTVESRANLFAKLHAHILGQCEGKPVEVIVACDNKEISIGKKRQNLLEQATGEWVVYVDDDDWIADTYVDRILAALSTNPDCVGFRITCTQNGRNPRRAIASLRYKEWGENRDGYDHVRSPYQKTPVRRSIALKVGFPDLRYGEDRVYSRGIVRLLKTEVFVDEVLYMYRFRSEPFAQKYGIVAKTLDYKGRRLR